MEMNNMLITGAGDPIKVNALWEAMAAEMNAYGAGPTKTAADWRTSLRSWKNQTRSKARSIAEHGRSTGGGPATAKTLTDIEQRALSLWGREMLDGLGVGRIGIGTDQMDQMDEPIAELPTNTQPTQPTLTPLQPHSPTAELVQNPPHSKAIRKQKEVDKMLESESKIATAITCLADKMGDVALQMANSNETLLELLKTQQMLLQLMMDRNNK